MNFMSLGIIMCSLWSAGIAPGSNNRYNRNVNFGIKEGRGSLDKRNDGRKTCVRSCSRQIRVASLLLLIFLSSLFAGCYETLLLPPVGSETGPVISGASPTRSILPKDVTPALSPTPYVDLETIPEREFVSYITGAINNPGLAASMMTGFGRI